MANTTRLINVTLQMIHLHPAEHRAVMSPIRHRPRCIQQASRAGVATVGRRRQYRGRSADVRAAADILSPPPSLGLRHYLPCCHEK